jgi:hypothetical protein
LKRPFTIREKIEGMTMRELAGEALLRTRRRISRAIIAAGDDPAKTHISDEALQHSLNGKSIAGVANRIRGGELCLTPGLADLARTAAAVKELFPDSIENARTEAEAILAHRITLFERLHDLGRQIDWRRDPCSGVRWPLEHFTRTPLVIASGADIRVVWELSRLHQLVMLGRAYPLTKDERFTEEFLIQLASWNEQNPPRFGPNWKVAMEAAIRAVNTIAALQMFRGSQLVTDQAIKLILKMLLAHGRFIRANLEFSYRAASNHYLSDLIGLFVIGTAIPEFDESQAWVSYSTERLLLELDRQVLADGVDYEGAIGYHRLVLEIFALFFTISRERGTEIPARYWDRLETMFDFVRHYLKPDGAAPMIGDSDDGRLIKFKPRAANDHSYLMSLGAVMFESGKFKRSNLPSDSTSDSMDEEALWWFGNKGHETFTRLVASEQPASGAFPEGQIFIQRAATSHGPLYAIIDCGDHGARGRGSHAHSDALSMEIFAFNRTFLRDPGTFVYTASEEDRNLFRSTAYHNTVRIDGKEISQTREGWPFALAANVRPKVNSWQSDSERDVLDAEHYAYNRLAAPVTHRRIVTLDKREGYWTIEDSFTGEGRHLFEFFFNFDAGLEVRIEQGRAVARAERSALAVVPSAAHAFETELSERSISPSYGTRVTSSGIIFRLNVEVPFENAWLLIPYTVGEEARIAEILRQW